MIEKEIPFVIYIIILFVHWLADFVFQSHKMATKKSTSKVWLTKHVLTYSLITVTSWSFFIIPLSEKEDIIPNLCMVWIITFVTHWFTDYVTSKITSRLYKEGKVHDFFVIVGVDQMIHYTTLLLTYCFLILK